MLDDDQIILVRIGTSKILVVSLYQHMHLYNKRMRFVKPEDNKILIDIVKPGNEIDIGFKRLAIDDDKFSSDSEKDLPNEEDHDADNDTAIVSEQDIGFDIWAIA